MATSTSIFRMFKEDSWRPTLRSYRRRILRRKTKSEAIVIDGKVSTTKISVAEVSRSSSENEFKTQRALYVVEGNKYELCESRPMPEFKADNEVIIRNHATGLNPIDWKSLEYNFCLPSLPWITGREMAGIVHKVAPGVSNVKPGDRVWTSTYYKDVRAGCFQDFVTVPAHTVLPIPENLTFEDAACLGVAALTASMTLWKWLRVPLYTAPAEQRAECILIWGGSTITGQFAVQIAALSGLEVIAVTSEKTRALVESLGAKHVITRDGKTNQEIVEILRKVGGERITRGLDLVGGETAIYSLQALSQKKECLFAPLAMMRSQEVAENVTVVNVEMKQFVLDEPSSFYAKDLNDLVRSGNLRLPELTILPGGLAAVEGGLERLKKGDMGGKKIIVSFSS